MLYNSDLSFGKRLYGTLDVDLTRVKLHEPISLIVQQPLLFVRDMVPRSCFISLNKLDEVSTEVPITTNFEECRHHMEFLSRPDSIIIYNSLNVYHLSLL